MTEPVAPEAPETPNTEMPTPADVANRAAKELEAEEKSRGPQDYEAEIAKLRKENAGWRTKYREAEPIVKAHEEAREAAKTEVQREREAREELQRERDELFVGYTRLEVAATKNVPPDLLDFLGSGSREEMEERADRLIARLPSSTIAPPPSNRPVEGLRPGATPEPPRPADDSYPASWVPPHLQQTS